MNNSLPIYKWTGGKRKEIKIFSNYYPEFVKNSSDYKYIEPFFGGGAVYWSLNAKYNIINDIDYDLINFLNEIKHNFNSVKDMVSDYGEKISKITELEKNKIISISEAKTQRGQYFYEWRNKDRNDGLKNLSNLDRAFRFFIVNQLAFNGMRRFNSRGEFNIPYGNYKQFNINVSREHIDLLNKTEILNCSYDEIILNNDYENTFIYLDPPYTREFNEYSHDNIFGKEQQIKLAEIFKGIKNANIMIIINKDEFTYDLYKDYIKDEYDLKYSTNIKNRYDNNVKHLIICNY
jgi:DNA adenine methylase